MRSHERAKEEKGVAGSANTSTHGTSPEADVRRNPQNGQALTDRSLGDGEPDSLPDGGARSARHTGDKTANP